MKKKMKKKKKKNKVERSYFHFINYPFNLFSFFNIFKYPSFVPQIADTKRMSVV